MKAFFVVALFVCLVSSDAARSFASSPAPSTAGPTASPVAAATSTAEPQLDGPVPGLYMSDFTLKSLAGPTLSLHDVEGKALVVNFFATWCPPCRAETAGFVKVANEVRPDNIGFVGIDFDEKPEVVQKFTDAQHMTAYPILLDDGGKIESQLGINEFPTTLIVGSDGIVRYAAEGEMSESDLSLAIQAATDKPLTRQQFDYLDREGVSPLATYTFELGRNDSGNTESGTFRVDVLSRADDYVGVRGEESWSDTTPELRYFGAVSPDGALDFGSQPLDAQAVAIFSFFAKHIGDGHSLDQNPTWAHYRFSQKMLLSTRLTLTAVSGSQLSLHDVSTALWLQSTSYPMSYAADVVYDNNKGLPVSGTITSGGKTVTFSLRRH